MQVAHGIKNAFCVAGHGTITRAMFVLLRVIRTSVTTGTTISVFVVPELTYGWMS